MFWTVLTCKRFLICADFSPDSDQTTFHLRKRYGLWTRILFKNILMMFFVLQTRSFCLLKMLTDGLEWCGLLWCFYQLFGLSFWRHPFTAEDLLVRQWCNATFLQIWWRNKLLYIADDLRVGTFLANFHFRVNYSFKGHHRILIRVQELIISSWRLNSSWVMFAVH